MYKSVRFFAAFLFLATSSIMLGKGCVNPVNVVCPQMSCNVNVVYLSQADVGPNGIVLDTPNTRYCFIESITWAPPVTLSRATPGPSSPIAAITITANNIELDLNGYTLQQSGGASYAVGVYITNGSNPSAVDTTSTPLNNIIIRNGTIQNLSTAGILVNKVNAFLLEDLYLVRNGGSGYILCPCTAQRTGGLVYVSFTPGQTSPLPYLTNHIWRNIHCDSNSSSFVTDNLFAQGADISGVDQVLIENCTFNNNFCGAAGNLISVEMLTNTNVNVINSQSNGNSSLTLNGIGFAGSLTNFVFENCQANSNSGLASGMGFSIGSADPVTPVINGVFSNCQANGNNITGDGSTVIPPAPPALNILYAQGFQISGDQDVGPATGITFSNCVANNQTSTVTGFTGHKIHAYGFTLNFVQDVQIDHCVACLNVALPAAPSLPLGDGEGFYIDGYDVTLTNCRAEYNRGNAGPYSNSEQYDIFPFYAGIAYNINLINCVAIGDPTDPLGIGIYAYYPNNCVIEGCLIESNVYDGILIDVAECPYASQNVIKHNQILAPNPLIFGGPTGRWAIEDLSGSGPDAPVNTYYDNYAWNYPGNGPGFANYSTGVRLAGNAIAHPFNGFITPWTVPGDPPSYTGLTKLTNLDITNGPC